MKGRIEAGVVKKIKTQKVTKKLKISGNIGAEVAENIGVSFCPSFSEMKKKGINWKEIK